MKSTKKQPADPAETAETTTDQLLAVKTVADRLAVSARQVWKLLASGRLPQPIRLGRSVRWRQSDLDKFVRVGCDMTRFAPNSGADI